MCINVCIYKEAVCVCVCARKSMRMNEVCVVLCVHVGLIQVNVFLG